ncbi:MAG: hypothetical protein R3188_03440, partial [Acidiferrobacterales bacterium]|nr:hypothetical protein [Acidiferrobacterales bacterium]
MRHRLIGIDWQAVGLGHGFAGGLDGRLGHGGGLGRLPVDKAGRDPVTLEVTDGIDLVFAPQHLEVHVRAGGA